MSAWIQGGYDGLFYLGEKGTYSYRGYVVRTVEDDVSAKWFAYSYESGEHKWVAEGSGAEAMKALEGDRAMDEETRYTVATYSYACTAYVRTTLRRALELQGTQNVWAGNGADVAQEMLGSEWADILPDRTTWELTKLELMTTHRALEWRKGKRKAGETDHGISESTTEEWAHIEDEIYRVLQGIWHSEGKYWV
ncbi:hypothetical protein OG306_33115 [Streptomyces sp. NBC_01241]|uniref:hypothetical protein n=1 Tax=Streptomyces sp. NBC_01241 TaxID=2903794 RepID=UPI00352F386E|nr:hypothetical protein OG306_33115 [Streptomyces sp. NBC_01241]